VYVAFDCDVLRPGELAVFMPEPGGPTVAEAEVLLRDIAARCAIAGLGLTGLHEDADPAVLVRLAAAAGL
jgi:arginase family enzyme